MRAHRVRSEGAQHEQPGRRRQPGRVVDRALKLHRQREAGVLLPRDDQGIDPAPPRRGDRDQGGAARGERPLVQVADPEVGADGGHVERQHARDVGAVDQHRDVVLVGGGGDLAYGQDLGGAGGDLVDDEQLRPARPQRRPDPGHHLARRRAQRERNGPRGRPGPAALTAGGQRDRPVDVIGEQHLVAGLESDRLQDQRDPGGGVREQRAALRVGAEEPGHVPSGVDEPVDEALRVELDRVGLDLVPQALLGALHTQRDRAEPSVVEVRDRRIQREQQPGPRDGRGRIGWTHPSIVRSGQARFPRSGQARG